MGFVPRVRLNVFPRAKLVGIHLTAQGRSPREYISEGEAQENTFNCTSGTNPYTPESHGTGYMYPDTCLPPSRSMPVSQEILSLGNSLAATIFPRTA